MNVCPLVALEIGSKQINHMSGINCVRATGAIQFERAVMQQECRWNVIILTATLHAILPSLCHACASDEYYTPQVCRTRSVTTQYECRKCVDNALQYVAADESCVCYPGYYATGQYNRCWEYKGNGGIENVVWPAVEDTFTCTKCQGGDMCLGGAYKVPTTPINWLGDAMKMDDFFTPCPACASKYRRVTWEEAPVLALEWKLQHAPKRFCKIFGQTWKADTCKCPEFSDVVFSLQMPQGMPVLAGFPDGVWNYNVQPLFEPPTPIIVSNVVVVFLKFFGR